MAEHGATVTTGDDAIARAVRFLESHGMRADEIVNVTYLADMAQWACCIYQHPPEGISYVDSSSGHVVLVDAHSGECRFGGYSP